MVYVYVILSIVSLISVYWLRKRISDLELLALYCVYIIGLQPVYVVITVNMGLIKMVNKPEAAIITKAIGLIIDPLVSLWMVALLCCSAYRIWTKLGIFLLASAIFSGIDFILVATGYLSFPGWGLWQSVLRHLVLSFTGLLFARWYRRQIYKERVRLG